MSPVDFILLKRIQILEDTVLILTKLATGNKISPTEAEILSRLARSHESNNETNN